jgi:hypothetical protein
MPGKIEQLERYEIFPEAAEALGIERYIPTKEREKIPDEDFAWPDAPDGPKYPCDTQDHVDSCAKLLGHAPDDKQASIKSRAIKIAKKHGFTIPESWQEEEKPVNKTDEADILRTMPSEVQIYAPIVRIDKSNREITLRATSEAKDSYRTVIDYNGSKEAFSKWPGNIREMHDPHKAVGRAFKVDPVEDEKAVDITLRVSRGAEDTWQKVLDKTLIGGSIGARNGKWGQREIDGEVTPVLERYDLVEVSLVDNPSNPDCNISVIRADGIATEVLEAENESQTTTTATQAPDTARVGAKLSADSQKLVHAGRDHALKGAQMQMKLCPCDECTAGSKHFDPDGDGDIDFIPSLDADGDGMGGADGDGSGDGESRALRALIQRIIAEELSQALTKELSRHMVPHTQRLNGIASRLAQTPDQPEIQQQSPDIERRFNGLESNFTTELDKVRTVLTVVEDLVKRIAEQPQQPQPIVNTSAVNPDVLRMFQHDTVQQQQTQQQDLTEMARSGRLDRQQQINAAVAFLTGNNGSRR